MARALMIFMATDKVPSRKSLQAALDELGFKIVLDDDYRPLKTRGYLPCALDGEDAGFDLRFEAADAKACAQYALPADSQSLSLRWAGDPRELLAALAFATALTKNFGAIAVENDTALTLDELTARAKKAAASL